MSANQAVLMSTDWPSPCPLEGVKSRDRAIFDIKNALVKVGDDEFTVANISLTLASRILAIGPAGQALADVLLGVQQPVSGSVYRHDKLAVLHLGPQLSSKDGILAALEKSKPHVLVFSYAIGDGESWAATFRDIVDSDELRSFKGAVVIHVAEEAHIASNLCSVRCIVRGKQIRVEKVSVGAIMIDDICCKTQDNEAWRSLRLQVSKLAAVCFDDTTDHDSEFDISTVAQEQGWTVAALVVNNPAVCATSDCQLLGYVTYNLEPALGGFYLARVAVVPEFRSRGHAYDLVRWMIERTHREHLDSIWVNATPTMQRIHAAMNFKYCDPAHEAKCEEDKGSTWMELQLETPKQKCVPAKAKCKRGRKGHVQKKK